MPQVQSVSFDNEILTVKDDRGTHQFTSADIPNNIKTATALETRINSVWIPSFITDYQMQVHVFSLSPLSLTIHTANLGEVIPPNWWLE